MNNDRYHNWSHWRSGRCMNSLLLKHHVNNREDKLWNASPLSYRIFPTSLVKNQLFFLWGLWVYQEAVPKAFEGNILKSRRPPYPWAFMANKLFNPLIYQIIGNSIPFPMLPKRLKVHRMELTVCLILYIS